jgi:hypothetical protein
MGPRGSSEAHLGRETSTRGAGEATLFLVATVEGKDFDIAF